MTAAGERAFVVGATGYTGRAVVAAVRRREIETIAHARASSPTLPKLLSEFEALGATVDATPLEAAPLTETFRRFRPTVVFALLGTTRSKAREAAARGERADYETVDYGMTKAVLDAALAAGSGPRFVYLSAMGVRAASKNPYIAVRWRFERELEASGLPYVIARPAFVSGPDRDERRTLERVGTVVGDGFLSALAALGARRLAHAYTSLTGAELGEALVAAAIEGAPFGDRGRTLSAGELRTLAATGTARG